MRNVCIIWVTMLAGCHIPEQEVALVIPNTVCKSTDTACQVQNGIRFYGGQPFSGYIETYFSSGALSMRQGFYEGKEEGLATGFYENGQRNSRRFYHRGEKDGINEGWWPNGHQQYEYHFKNGVYEGVFREWYESGKPLKYIVYHNGTEQSGKGWRENGKTYMSFVWRDGRLYGLVNPNLCYTLKNEMGEFSANAK